MPDIVEVEATICLLARSECRDNRLRKKMVFEIAEVVRIPQQKIGKGKSGEARLAGGAEVEGAAGHIRLRIVVISRLVLETEVIPMASTHQSQTRGQIVLRVPVLNKTLPLRTHDIVGKIGDTGSRRGSHDRRYGHVVTGGPRNRSQIKPRVFRRAIVFEPAEAGVEINGSSGAQTVI